MTIAFYHRPTNLYEILNKILEINPDYTFIPQFNSEFREELVLYCIPKC